jgi:hypothetical protein
MARVALKKNAATREAMANSGRGGSLAGAWKAFDEYYARTGHRRSIRGIDAAMGVPDEKGAAFADIHQIHSADTFAAAALVKLEGFLASVMQTNCKRPQRVLVGHPFQSATHRSAAPP